MIFRTYKQTGSRSISLSLAYLDTLAPLPSNPAGKIPKRFQTPWWAEKHKAQEVKPEPIESLPPSVEVPLVEVIPFSTLDSSMINLRTLKNRIIRFSLIEGEDYTITIGKYGKKSFHITNDMIQWVNRRLY